MENESIKFALVLLLIDFLSLAAVIFIPEFGDFIYGMVGSEIYFFQWGILLLLGGLLVYLALKQKVFGWLKIFLLFAGASPAGLVFFVLLHNCISALAGLEDPVSFILAVVVCPVLFIVGATGSFYQLFIRKNGQSI